MSPVREEKNNCISILHEAQQQPGGAVGDGTTFLRTTTVLRLCTINPRATREDIIQVVIDRLEHLAQSLGGVLECPL